MKEVIPYILIGFTLLSCGGPLDKITIEGKFTHLQQGEFYIYTEDGPLERIDTITVQNGRFEYTAALNEPAQFHLLYPNFSEHIIFAYPGDKIKIEGDANNLKETQIKGNDANKAFTAFRLDNLDKPEKELIQAARTFILEHPASPVSTYLFRRYILSNQNDSAFVHEVYDSLYAAQPDNRKLPRWQGAVERINLCQTGSRLPSFSIPLPNGDTVKSSDYQGRYLLLAFWASWNNASTSILFRTKYLQSKCDERLAPISCSLDIDSIGNLLYIRRDTITWPNICDYQAWQSPLVKQLGIEDVPYLILTDSLHNIIAQGNKMEDIEPVLKKKLFIK